MSEIKTIALLGQPNSGKSTLFNNLTGLHQRVGNWPGKTVEQAEGEFVFDGTTYKVIDLPGSYGLSANSEEEVVTRDYIQSGKADLVCILVDASQLERSLYMLADFVGIRMPVMLVINMMDVAEAAGKKIDVAAIEMRLGVPVLGFSAAETGRYPEFFKKMVSAIKTPVCLDSGSLREELVDEKKNGGDVISRIEAALGDFEYGECEKIWIAEKLLEKDKLICGVVRESLPFARKNAIDAILDSEEGRDGGILTGEAKYRWVSKIVRETATSKSIDKVFSKCDRIATHHIKGKFFAFGIMVISLIACMILAFPGMGIGFGIQPVLQSLVERAGNALGVWPVAISFINLVLVGGACITICMFYLSSRLFGKKLVPQNERVGMIMELPPYHKPHWKMIAAMVGRSTWGIFNKALKMILMVAALFWALSYAGDGNVENTLLYKIGNAIEPVTMFFGMRWELFVSYLGGMFSKEASLGIMSTLFNHTGEAFSLVTRVAASENLGEALASTISKPEALAFLFASMFNVPCVLAMGTTYREAGSFKWLATIMGYYLALSLGLAFIGYHVGLLIF